MGLVPVFSHRNTDKMFRFGLRCRSRHGEMRSTKAGCKPLSRDITPTLARTGTRLGSFSSSGKSLVNWMEDGEVACDQVLMKPIILTTSACTLLSQSE